MKFSYQKSITSDNKGFSLVEVVIATAIVSLVFLSIGILLNMSFKIFSVSKEDGVKNQLQFSLMQAIYNEKGMKINCEKNSNLRRCFDKGSSSCLATETFQPLDIYDLNGERLSGTPTDPVYWDVDGARCGVKSINCNIRVETTFRVQGYPEELPGCVGDCRSYNPTLTAPSNHLHELLIVKYSILKDTNIPMSSNAWTPSLPERYGTIIVGLDETYNKYVGCPNP